jgi:hypothetical protein
LHRRPEAKDNQPLTSDEVIVAALAEWARAGGAEVDVLVAFVVRVGDRLRESRSVLGQIEADGLEDDAIDMWPDRR